MEISVNISKMNSMADILEKRAETLEHESNRIDSVKNKLKVGNSSSEIRYNLNSIQDNVHESKKTILQMSSVLRQIAAEYRKTENSITGSLKSKIETITQVSQSVADNNIKFTQNGKDRSSSLFSEDPVNLNTGNFILDNTDLEIQGVQPLILGRFYNSISEFRGMLGRDWNSSFEIKLCGRTGNLSEDSELIIVQADGREENFFAIDEKRYNSTSTAKLYKCDDSFVYQTIKGERYFFDREGKYYRFENRHNVGFDLLYENNQLKKVVKDTGEYFLFSYDENSFLKCVQDHVGRECKYEFYDGKLSKVKRPDGSTYRYEYTAKGKLCKVYNPLNMSVVETQYDDNYRVIHQTFADGTTNEFEYNDAERAVIMTERNDTVSIHYHNEKYQNVRNVYLDGEESFEYNDKGQKIKIKDKLGNITRIQYDERGNITVLIMPDKTKYVATYDYNNQLLSMRINGKNRIHNSYNKYGDLISSSDALDRTTSYSYDEKGYMTSITLPDKTVIYTKCDERGNLCEITGGNGERTTFLYDSLNRIIETQNALNQKNNYEYDVCDRIVSEVRADNQRKSYKYDLRGNLIEIKDYDDSVTKYIFNENNLPTAVIDAAGNTTNYEYDSMWNVCKVILPNKAIFSYEYDSNNRLCRIIDPENNLTTLGYDAMGNLTSYVNAEGIETKFVLDSNGNCVKRIFADGNIAEMAYDADNQVTYYKDVAGIELFRTYDEAEQLVLEKDSCGRTRSFLYDELGNVSAVIDEKGGKTEYKYMKGLNKIKSIDYPNGTRSSFDYDELGNLITSIDIFGKRTNYYYDILNRPIKIENYKGEYQEFKYDLAGRVLESRDYSGNRKKYTYSIMGELLSVVDALGNEVLYSYDEINQLTKITRKGLKPEDAITLLYEYNLNGQLSKITDALGEEEAYYYNGNGYMTKKIDRGNYSTQYNYSEMGLLQEIQWEDGKKVNYSYDALGKIIAMEDWNGKTDFKYDNWGNLTCITYPDTRTLQKEYDKYGNIVKIIYPNEQEVRYEYDTLNRLKRINSDEQKTEYEYDTFGRIILRKMGNDSIVEYKYNEDGLLKAFIHSNENGIIDKQVFEYDSLGRRNMFEEYCQEHPDQEEKFEYFYDSTGHLENVYRNHKQYRQYGYDSLGQRDRFIEFDELGNIKKEKKYRYDRRGGLLCIEGSGKTESFVFDSRGNVIEQYENNNIVRKFEYNAMNRLAKVIYAHGENEEYGYNGLGYRNRIETYSSEKKSEILYASDYTRIYDNLMEVSSSEKNENYIWGNGLEGFSLYRDVREDGWYLPDQNGSIVRKFSTSRTVYRTSYDEFGNLDKLDGTINLGDMLYSGFMRDDISGTYFAQARQYRTETGTFDAMDRIGGDITMPETLNPYVYCMQDPFSKTDKSGYYFGIDDAIAAGVGAVGGLAGQLIGDVINGVCSGKWELSSWQEYTGAAIGGAAGGVTTLYAGPVAGGAVSAGVSNLTTEGLTYLSNPQGYNKSMGDVMLETTVDAGMGALSGLVGKYISKATKMITNKFLGYKPKPDNSWSAMGKFIKNQHDLIGKSTKCKEKLIEILQKNLPNYFKLAILDKIKDTINPLKGIWKFGKDKLSSWIKDILGLKEEMQLCLTNG